MGESRQDRAGLLQQLANLPEHPESVPINLLVKVAGTPLDQVEALDPLELVRTIATARILMPDSQLRLSAGREGMEDGIQALCFFAGANSVFVGEKLLTTPLPETSDDMQLFKRLGIQTETHEETVEASARTAALVEAARQEQRSGQYYDATQARA